MNCFSTMKYGLSSAYSTVQCGFCSIIVGMVVVLRRAQRRTAGRYERPAGATTGLTCPAPLCFVGGHAPAGVSVAAAGARNTLSFSFRDPKGEVLHPAYRPEHEGGLSRTLYSRGSRESGLGSRGSPPSKEASGSQREGNRQPRGRPVRSVVRRRHPDGVQGLDAAREDDNVDMPLGHRRSSASVISLSPNRSRSMRRSLNRPAETPPITIRSSRFISSAASSRQRGNRSSHRSSAKAFQAIWPENVLKSIRMTAGSEPRVKL